MPLVNSMRTGVGRAARIAAGLAMVGVGLALGGGGLILSIVGLVSLAAGAFGLRLIAPLLRQPLRTVGPRGA
jgi:hypothetical protein